jgi:hypothetical protein
MLGKASEKAGLTSGLLLLCSIDVVSWNLDYAPHHTVGRIHSRVLKFLAGVALEGFLLG